MQKLVTLHDIKNRKNVNYKHRGRLAVLINDRIIEACGRGVDIADFEIATATDNANEYVIRHKYVQTVNSATIEPFVRYGVEYVSVNYALPNNRRYSREFSSMKEAVAFAQEFDLSVYLIKLQTKPVHASVPNEQLQRQALNGKTISEHFNVEFDISRQRIKRARLANELDKIAILEGHARKLRKAVWEAEDNAKLAWRTQDYSLFEPNPLFPSINSVILNYFLHCKKVA
jgi:hypothetical protein